VLISVVVVDVPQDGIWSPILFNLHVRHISRQVLNCALFEYADDSSLVKVIRRLPG